MSLLTSYLPYLVDWLGLETQEWQTAMGFNCYSEFVKQNILLWVIMFLCINP